MNDENIINILKTIGLNKNQAAIYHDLVKNRNSGALEVSKRTNIHRSNTYEDLRKLIEKGLVSKSIKNNKTIFRATFPDKLKDYIEQDLHSKLDNIKMVLPSLIENYNDKGSLKEEIMVSEGIFSLREALKSMLKSKETIKVIGASKDSVEILGLGFLKEFHKERIKNKIWMKHIFDRSYNNRVKMLNRMKYTEARMFAQNYICNSSTNICKDQVIIFVPRNTISVITIKDERIADTYHKLFESLWQYSLEN